MLNAKLANQFVEQIWDDSIIPTLCEYVRIPLRNRSESSAVGLAD